MRSHWNDHSVYLTVLRFIWLLWKDDLEVTSSLCSVTHTASRSPSFMKCCSLLILLLLKCLHGISWFRNWSHVLPLVLQCRPQPLICPHTQPSPLCSAVWIPRSASCAFKLAPSAPPSLSLLPVFDLKVSLNFPQMTRILLNFKMYSNSISPKDIPPGDAGCLLSVLQYWLLAIMVWDSCSVSSQKPCPLLDRLWVGVSCLSQCLHK